MKKVIFCMIVFISLLTIAYIEEGIAGPPANYVMDLAYIQGNSNNCYACANEGAGPCIGASDQGESIIDVVINKNTIEATCKFTNISGGYEPDAVVVDIIDCSLWAGPLYMTGGTGKIITAANHGEDPEGIGGNVTMKCTFDFDIFVDNYCNCEPCDSCCPEPEE